MKLPAPIQVTTMVKSGDDETLHQEALRRLCFACKKVFKAKERRYEVEKHLEMISKAMDCVAGVFTMDGITPSHFCHPCKFKLSQLASGKTITTSRRLIDWEACTENCETCAYMTQQKKGGGRKKVSGILFIYLFIHFFFKETQILVFNARMFVDRCFQLNVFL